LREWFLRGNKWRRIDDRSSRKRQATCRAEAIMDQSDSGRIAALLDDFNAMAAPA
jgi:hypothetical protein